LRFPSGKIPAFSPCWSYFGGRVYSPAKPGVRWKPIFGKQEHSTLLVMEPPRCTVAHNDGGVPECYCLFVFFQKRRWPSECYCCYFAFTIPCFCFCFTNKWNEISLPSKNKIQDPAKVAWEDNDMDRQYNSMLKYQSSHLHIQFHVEIPIITLAYTIPCWNNNHIASPEIAMNKVDGWRGSANRKLHFMVIR